MSEILIPFREDMAQAAIEGRKSCTSRTRKYGRPDDTFLIKGKKFVLVNVQRWYLNDVAADRFQEEGFDSPEAFVDCWVELHPRKGFIPFQFVWLHTFEKVA